MRLIISFAWRLAVPATLIFLEIYGARRGAVVNEVHPRRASSMGVRSVALWSVAAAGATLVALPAVVVFIWAAVLGAFLVGVLGIVRFLLRLWNPRLGVILEERKQLRKQRMQKREARKLEIEEGIGMTAAESRFLLVHQYLQDQLDTITQHLHVHAGDSDSLLDLHPVAPRSSIADDFDHSPHSAFSSIHDSGCLRRTRTG